MAADGILTRHLQAIPEVTEADAALDPDGHVARLARGRAANERGEFSGTTVHLGQTISFMATALQPVD